MSAVVDSDLLWFYVWPQLCMIYVIITRLSLNMICALLHITFWNIFTWLNSTQHGVRSGIVEIASKNGILPNLSVGVLQLCQTR